MDNPIGILTVSDRCFKRQQLDESGPHLQRLLQSRGFTVKAYAVVPDEAERIQQILRNWCDIQGLSLIVTTGGTGVGPRDVTPEATRPLLHRELPGFAELMRVEGLKHTLLAICSRAVAGIRGKTLIINLPGSPNGAVQSLMAVWEAVPHVFSMVQGCHHDNHGKWDGVSGFTGVEPS